MQSYLFNTEVIREAHDRSIRNEGISIGRDEGISIGRSEGIAIGEQRAAMRIAELEAQLAALRG